MEFNLENTESFSNAIFPLLRFHEAADLKCSPTLFSFLISRHFPFIITSLQILPPFFTHFLCDNQTYQGQIPIKFLHHTMNTMRQTFYCSMTLSLAQPNHVSLQFRKSRDGQPMLLEFPLLPSREEDVGEIDYGTFVLIESYLFKLIATELDHFNNNALVVVTNSKVKFIVEGREITLGEEGKDCIIGGVAKGEEARFFVHLNPIIFFRDLTRLSKWIWLFKSPESYSIIVAPIGLHAQFCVYFSPKRTKPGTEIV